MRPLLGLIILLVFSGVAEAHHNQPPVLPTPGGRLGSPTFVIQKVLERGYLTYSFDVGAANYPGFRQQAADVAWAGLAVVGIPAGEVASNPDLWLTMPEDQLFIRICGQGAAACILYWTDPIVVYFRRALFYSDWRGALAHEGIGYGHTFLQHEQYDDINFRCLRQTWTVMDCSSGVWWQQEYDTFSVWSIVVPDRPRDVSFDVAGSWATVGWSNFRADGGEGHNGNPYNDNATRIAFGFARPGDPIQWVGEICPDLCYAPYSAGYRGFDAWWRPGCFYIRAENATLAGTFVPQISQEGHWGQAVGCW